MKENYYIYHPMGCLRIAYYREIKILKTRNASRRLRIIYLHGEVANTWAYLNNGLDIDGDQDNDNIADWVGEIASSDWVWFNRGYTGHEMLPEFGLINMNGRAYDPVLGRMLQVDNYIQNPYSSRSYNRYSYVLNNPLKYVDPDGEFAFVPFLIGAAIGGYSGYKIGESQGVDGLKLVGYIFGGAVVGGVSGLAAHAVVTSSVAFANTGAIVVGSTTNSLGMNFVTGGLTDVSIGFGVGSFNLTQNTFGYLGKSGNTGLQNFGYSLGLFANLSDSYGFIKGAYGDKAGEIDLVTKNDPIGHSALVDESGNNIISVGPDYSGAAGESFFDAPGTNDWYNHLDDKGFDKLTVTKLRINNVRLDKISQYAKNNLSNFRYKALSCSCVTEASSALLKAGVLNIPFLRHPVLLQAQIFARNNAYYTSFIEY